MRKLILATILMWGATGQAGTVEKVMAGQDTIIIKLTPAEENRVKAGDDVQIRAGSATVDGEVRDVSGSKAKVYVVFGIDDVREGQSVRVGSKMRKNARESGSSGGGGSAFKAGGGQKTTFDNDLDMPFIFAPGPLATVSGAGRALNRYFAAQSVRFSKAGGTMYLGTADTKGTEKGDFGKVVTDGTLQQFGVAPVYNVNGTRLSIAYDKHVQNFKVTNKPDGGETSKSKVEIDASSISLSGARVFGNGLFFGARLVSHDYEVTFDARDTGGEKSSGSEAISEFQLSLGLADPNYEVAIEYVPPIDITEDEVAVARPVTWALNYRRKMAGMDALAGFYHALYSSLTDTLKNRQAASLGGLWYTGFGSFSGLLNYATKYHSETEYAGWGTVATFGATLASKYVVDGQSNVGVTLDYEMGEGNGERGDDGTDLEFTALTALVSYARHY